VAYPDFHVTQLAYLDGFLYKKALIVKFIQFNSKLHNPAQQQQI